MAKILTSPTDPGVASWADGEVVPAGSAVGDLLRWDGAAWVEIAASADAGEVLTSNGAAAAPTYQDPVQTLADPGDGNAITVTAKDTFVALVCGAGAETRTVTDPTSAGLRLTLFMVTNGGGTLRPDFASAIDLSGNTFTRFSAVGQVSWFISVPNGGAFRWQYMGSDAGSTPGSGIDNQLIRDSP